MCLLQQIIPIYFLAGCNIFGHNGTLASTNNGSLAVGTEFIFYMVELARFLGGLFIIQKVKEEVRGEPSLENERV